MSNSTVLNLNAARQIDPGRWLTGPLRLIQLVTLGPGEQREIGTGDSEHTLFTLHGRGMLIRAGVKCPLGPKVAVTLPLGTRVTIVAGPEELEYFQASMDVPGSGSADGPRTASGDASWSGSPNNERHGGAP